MLSVSCHAMRNCKRKNVLTHFLKKKIFHSVTLVSSKGLRNVPGRSFVMEGKSEEFCRQFEKFGHYQPSALSLGQLANFGEWEECWC